MIRALRPTDLLSYLTFRKQALDNEALSRLSHGATPPAMATFFEGLLAIEPSREHWVFVDRREIVGLVTASARPGADVWDVSRLMSLPTADPGGVYVRLLEHLCGAAVEEGIHKVFLRLREASETVGAARQAGLFRYTAETVFQHPGAPLLPTGAGPAPRPRRPVDHQGLFQLYSATVPLAVRQIEGLTLQEWRWTDGWSAHEVWRLGNLRRRDFVVSDGRAAVGWLQVDPRPRLLRVMVAGRDATLARGLIAFGLSYLGPNGPVVLPIPDYQVALRREVEDLGFVLVERHALLARTLALRATESRLVPIGAS